MSNEKQYNEKIITIDFKVYNSSLNVVNDDEEKNPKEEKMPLNADNIIDFELENRVFNPVAFGFIEYDDYADDINFMKIGFQDPVNTVLILTLEDPTESMRMDLEFIVSDIKILGMDNSKTKYRIDFHSKHALCLNKQIPYATKNDVTTGEEELESPYDIARALLIKSGYEESYCNDMPYTNNRIHFITGHNTTVEESVNALLAEGVGTIANNEPVYLVNSLSESKWKMLTMGQMLRGQSCGMNLSNYIPLSYTELPIVNNPAIDMKINYIKSFSRLDTESFANKLKLLNNYEIEEYSHEDRKWSSYKTLRTSLNEMMTTNRTWSGRSLFMNWWTNLDAEYETCKTYTSEYSSILYDILRTLECEVSMLTVDINGSLTYDIGQTINIDESGGGGDDFKNLAGSWVILAVRHAFRQKTFTTNILACRQTFLEFKEEEKQA